MAMTTLITMVCLGFTLDRYMPILPMVLVNGAEGIGTGWSTYIPNYNPRDIVANIKRLLAGEEQVGH
jgi:DNA topoisomerase-2